MAERDSDSSAANETEITLGLLTAVEENEALTQRSAAHQLGIALGLTNAYLKRCIKKGLIKVQQVPPNRYAYYLTPQGFAEKSRLTAEYLSSSFTFFRRARSQCDELLAGCAARGWRRVALYGVSDLAEIAMLCAGEHEVALVGIAGPANGDGAEDGVRQAFHGLPVARELAALDAFDAVLLTDLATPHDSLQRIAATIPRERILAPPLLRLSRGGARRAPTPQPETTP